MNVHVYNYTVGDPSPFGYIKNFFYEANTNFIMNVVKNNATKSYDQAFEVEVWRLDFSEPYENGLFGGGIEKAERTIRKEFKSYLRKLDAIKATLPAGVTMEIKEGKSDDRRRLHMRFTVCVSATAEYSKKCFAAISDRNIVHDWDMPESFIASARAFKERVLCSKRDLLHDMKEKYCNIAYFSTERFFPPLEYDGWIPTNYHSLGMANLSCLEQCYGLAWAIAELSAPKSRCFLKVIDGIPAHSIYPPSAEKVVFLERPEKKTITTPKYVEW